MTGGESARARQSRKRTRIQAANEEKILDAALEVFSGYGLRGATLDQIAERAGMSKPNLLYYFRRKNDLYLAVLSRTLEMWLRPLAEMRAEGDPETELRRYIERKIEFSRDNPQESRLFASEVIQGAAMLKPVLETRLRGLVEAKCAVISEWAAAGKIAPIDPLHLILTIWATTQHYADFEAQIVGLLGADRLSPEFFEGAKHNVAALFLRGVMRG